MCYVSDGRCVLCGGGGVGVYFRFWGVYEVGSFFGGTIRVVIAVMFVRGRV